ncbi:MAG: RsbRD N-terminal domain-containing protein [Planctomycetota bacterium]
MTLGKLLEENRDAIVRKWFEDALATYSGDSSALFKRQKDPFANPVGHSLRVGTRAIFDALLDGMDAEKIREQLREIVKIRAVQDMSAPQAVGFVFELKQAIRMALGEAARQPQCLLELERIDGHVDQIALLAFDLFVESRERLCELRINEVKRRVSWVMDKMSARGFDPELAQVDPE